MHPKGGMIMFHFLGKKYPERAEEDKRQEGLSEEELKQIALRNEEAMKCVYAGPEEMSGRIPDGKPSMARVYAGPEYFGKFSQLEETTKLVYAPPEFLKKMDEGENA